MLITPPCGDGDVFIAKSSADPLQGLDEALLGEDEDDQVPLHTPGHEEVWHWRYPAKRAVYQSLGAAWPPTNFTVGDVGGTFSKAKDKNNCSIAHFGPILKTKVLLESPIHMLSKNFNFENQIKKWPTL